ncbi:MAG: adenosine kinase [Candidatus Woesearchaeota archaeon]
MLGIVCIGNALVDITLNVEDSFVLSTGLRKGTMTLAGDITQKFLLSSIKGMSSTLSTGGSAANVAIGFASCGGTSLFIGKVGRDYHGSFFKSSLEQRGVIPKLAESLDLITGSAVALISPDAERTFSTHLGASASLVRSNILDFPKSMFFHVEAYLLESSSIKEVVLDLIKLAKVNGSKISLDLSDPALIERIKPVLDDFLKLVDVVFANDIEAEKFTGKTGLDAARHLSNFCGGIAVVKLGERGSVIISGTEEVTIRPEVVKPINTNGAGDAYASGFLFALSKGFSLKKAGDIASIVAREVVLIEEAAPKSSLASKIAHLVN